MSGFDTLKVAKPKVGEKEIVRGRPWAVAAAQPAPEVLAEEPQPEEEKPTLAIPAKEPAKKSAKKTPPKEKKKAAPKQPAPRPAENDELRLSDNIKLPTANWYPIQNEILDLALSELTAGEERLYHRLRSVAWGTSRSHKNYCQLNVSQLSALLHTDQRNVRRLRDGLLKKGWLETVNTQQETWAQKNSLIYRIFNYEEILARRDGTFGQNNPGQIDHGEIDHGHNTLAVSSDNLSAESPGSNQQKPHNPLNSKEISKARSSSKKEEDKNNPPIPPQGGSGVDDDKERAGTLAKLFYKLRGIVNQPSALFKSDTEKILSWRQNDEFSWEVIEEAIRMAAKLEDTKSVKRAFYLLAEADAKLRVRARDTEEQRLQREERAREEAQHLAERELLEKIRAEIPPKDLQRIEEQAHDLVEAENATLPQPMKKSLTKVKVNQLLIDLYGEPEESLRVG